MYKHGVSDDVVLRCADVQRELTVIRLFPVKIAYVGDWI